MSDDAMSGHLSLLYTTYSPNSKFTNWPVNSVGRRSTFQTQTKAINHRVRHRLRIIENEGAVWWHLVYQSVQHWPLAADATSNTTSCLSTTDKWHYRRSVERRGYLYRHKHRGIAGDRITTVNTTAADQACFAGQVLKSWEKTGCPSPHFYV